MLRSAGCAAAWSPWWRRLRLALDALRAHKLRSFLTLLGVILAVTTLVAVMSVVAGLNFYVADRVANLGANVYLVDRFGIITSYDAWIKAQKRPLVTLQEYRMAPRQHEDREPAWRRADDQNIDIRSGKHAAGKHRRDGGDLELFRSCAISVWPRVAI